MTTTRKSFAERVAESHVEACARLEALSPEARAELETAIAGMHSRLVRWFVGTELAEKEGYMPGIVVSAEELQEFRKTETPTHRWAEWAEGVI